MLVNRSVLVCSQNRQICADLECDIRDRITRRTALDKANDVRIADELSRRKIQELIPCPLPHPVHAGCEMTLPDRPFDGVAGLDDIEHVNHGIEDSFEIECI